MIDTHTKGHILQDYLACGDYIRWIDYQSTNDTVLKNMDEK